MRYILGIRPLKPQYEEVLIQPLDCGDKLEWARGHIETDRGKISVHWKLAPKGYGLQVMIPANVTARIAVPRERPLVRRSLSMDKRCVLSRTEISW